MVTPEERVRLRLYDILDTIEGVRASFAGVTVNRFTSERVYRLAAERAVEIVSEASRHIPDEMKQTAPDVPWSKIAGIGNVLRHDYPKVEPTLIWDVISRDFDALEPVIRGLLAELPPED